MNYYTDVLKQYAVFSGRTRRKEFWMFTLFNFIIAIVLFGLAAATSRGGQPGGIFMILYYLYALAVLLPSLGVAVRRLHDTGRSGWWLLIGLVPFVGGIIVLIFYCLDSQPGENKWGPNPKGALYAASEPATLI